MFGQVLVMRLFRDHGILTQICGNNFMVLKVAPPLVATEPRSSGSWLGCAKPWWNWPIRPALSGRKLWAWRAARWERLMRLTRSILDLVATARLRRSLPTRRLDAGYRQMYDLRFEEAHQTFQDYREDCSPQDPMGPVSDAAAYLFSEFDRLHILQTELFVEQPELSLGR